MTSLRCLCPVLAMLLGITVRPLQTLAEEEVAPHARRLIDGLRGVQATEDKARLKELNERMDAAWSWLKAHPESQATVQEELAKAIAAPQPDHFLLLDLSYLNVETLGTKALEPATAALARIDPASRIVQFNAAELFHLVMKMGELGAASEPFFRQLDRIYLAREESLAFFAAPHSVSFGPFEMRCMVYGVAGPAAAAHLAQLLPEAKKPALILQVLSAIGSEAEVPAARAAMKPDADYETVSAGLTFMMQVGGPAGRAAVLALDSAGFKGQTRSFLAKTRPAVEGVNFQLLVEALAQLDPTPASDEKLQGLLDKMEQNNGADQETPPAAVAKSHLPTAPLLAQLQRIRARSFRRQNNHVLEELPMTDLLLNALQFKPPAP